MAHIKPFRALRYTAKAGAPERLICPPYDIISEEERREFSARDTHNAIHLELPVGETRYRDAAQRLEQWLAEGILTQDIDEGFYLYEEEFSVHGQTLKNKGIFCLLGVEDYASGGVLPHEETLREARADRFALLTETGCSFSSVYLLYEDPRQETRERLNRLSDCEPNRCCTVDGITHRLWLVNDPVVIRALQQDFTDRRLWIADGHHRYATALRYRDEHRETGGEESEEASYVFAFLADAAGEGLTVLPLHRLVRGVPDFSAESLIEACRKNFNCYEMPDPGNIPVNLDALFRQGQKAFAFYAGGDAWFLLRLKGNAPPADFLPDKSDAYRNLDVALLHGLILAPFLGITPESMADQKNLTYVREFDESIEAVRRGDQQCAFFVNPARVSEIQRIAEAGEKMPQKSTYFYPKLATGLVMRRLRP